MDFSLVKKDRAVLELRTRHSVIWSCVLAWLSFRAVSSSDDANGSANTCACWLRASSGMFNYTVHTHINASGLLPWLRSIRLWSNRSRSAMFFIISRNSRGRVSQASTAASPLQLRCPYRIQQLLHLRPWVIRIQRRIRPLAIPGPFLSQLR